MSKLVHLIFDREGHFIKPGDVAHHYISCGYYNGKELTAIENHVISCEKCGREFDKYADTRFSFKNLRKRDET